jgi:hypothetical protein
MREAQPVGAQARAAARRWWGGPTPAMDGGGRKRATQGRRRAGAGGVNLPTCSPSIQHGVLTWRAMQAKVVQMYHLCNTASLNIFDTVKVLNGDLPTVIMVKS